MRSSRSSRGPLDVRLCHRRPWPQNCSWLRFISASHKHKVLQICLTGTGSLLLRLQTVYALFISNVLTWRPKCFPFFRYVSNVRKSSEETSYYPAWSSWQRIFFLLGKNCTFKGYVACVYKYILSPAVNISSDFPPLFVRSSELS